MKNDCAFYFVLNSVSVNNIVPFINPLETEPIENWAIYSLNICNLVPSPDISISM